jgi:hypothetical protein
MKMWRQTCEHVEAGVIVKFANNPLAMIQNLIGQGSKKIAFRTFAVDLDQIDLRDCARRHLIAEPRTLLGRQGGRGP